MISANKTVREQLSRGKIWGKPTDQMDLWLDSQGYYRKHTAKDGSCLYRAISEQIFLAQAFHVDVRRHCTEYAERHPELLTDITHCSVSEYIDRMKHPHETGGQLELELMSRMYKRDFLVFHEAGKTFEQATDHGFEKQIMLCLSQDHHYDSVYTKQYISNAAFCQSLVYETLYKKVFQLQEVDYAVKKMLHDKSSKYQRDPSSFLMNGLALRLEIRDSYTNVKDLLTLGVTPFPYKVAKSLDPDIYRNVEYDTWNDIRRGLRYGTYVWNNRELGVGVKCLVRLPSDRVCHAHIQDMAPDKGPVLVFVEELGEKMTVPYDSLELLPQSPQPQPLTLPLKQLRQLQTLRELTLQELGDPEINDKNNNEDSPSSLTSEKEVEKDGRMTPKLKMLSELSKPNKKPNRPYRMKAKDNSHQVICDTQKHQVEDNAVVSSTSDCNFPQPEVSTSHQHENFEEYNSHRYGYQEVSEPSAERECPDHTVVDHSVVTPAGRGPPAMLCVEPHYYMQTAEAYAPPTSAYLPAPACYPAPDMPLPVSDIAPVRFYYNYGIDHYPRSVRPSPPCYLNTAIAYVPDPSVSPVVYEHGPTTPINTPDSAVVVSPGPVGVLAHRRPDSLPLPQTVQHPHSEPDSTTATSAHQPHNLAPRFKNKLRNMQAGRAYEVQQPEVSSTTNTPLPLPTHYVAPPPLYYHPGVVSVECDAYCPPSYLEYGVYEPSVMYYPTAAPPSHYIHPDHQHLVYQHLVAAPMPSAI